MSNAVGGVMDGDRYEELKGLLVKVSKVAREALSRSDQALRGVIESSDRAGGSKGQNPPPAIRGYLDIRMVADVFAVHPKTIETWIRTLGFPCLRVGGARRFDYDDVTRWASARREGS